VLVRKFWLVQRKGQRPPPPLLMYAIQFSRYPQIMTSEIRLKIFFEKWIPGRTLPFFYLFKPLVCIVLVGFELYLITIFPCSFLSVFTLRFAVGFHLSYSYLKPNSSNNNDVNILRRA
jgi:hypothetical protein